MRGGRRPGAGRKPGATKEIKRDVVRQVRWTAEEWKTVETLADEAGKTESEFIRDRTIQKKWVATNAGGDI